MKHYEGKVRALNSLNGEIKPKNPSGKISIGNRLGDLRTQIRNINTLAGVMGERRTHIGKRITRINTRYVFLAAIARIFYKFSAKANAAPTIDIEVDSVVTVDTETTLTPREAQEISADRGAILTAFAKLVAYNRAAAAYIRETLVSHVSKLIAADGAVATAKRKIVHILTSGASKANSAIVESRYNRFTGDHDAVGSSAPTADTTAETASTTGSTATVIPAAVADVCIKATTGTATAGKMATWIDPYIDGEGYLVIRQAYAATLTDGYLEVQ